MVPARCQTVPNDEVLDRSHAMTGHSKSADNIRGFVTFVFRRLLPERLRIRGSQVRILPGALVNSRACERSVSRRIDDDSSSDGSHCRRSSVELDGSPEGEAERLAPSIAWRRARRASAASSVPRLRISIRRVTSRKSADGSARPVVCVLGGDSGPWWADRSRRSSPVICTLTPPAPTGALSGHTARAAGSRRIRKSCSAARRLGR